jgi:hypothetical protein
MRRKHRNDQNHSKCGYCGGNPRYGKGGGNYKGTRQKDRAAVRGAILNGGR